jgi:dienelactone hydrolase
MSLWARGKDVWLRIRAWWSNNWMLIRPGPEVRRGVVWGTVAAALATVVIAGLTMRTGFGYAFDFGFAILFAALCIPLVMLGVMLLLTILRKLPRVATGIVIGCCVIVMMLWGPIGTPMAIVVGLVEGVLGATIATFIAGGLAQSALRKKILVSLLFAGGVAGNIYLVWLFAHAGSMDKLIAWKPPAQSMPAKLAVADPSTKGPYRVQKLFYGVGNDIRRPEYGASVAIKTRTVDASDFFKDFKGWKRWARKKYWKFDVDKLPLNARVWYPEGPGPFPLALIVHGNHNLADFSDPGYEYLGELLASRGFILASVDENFINGGLFHDPPLKPGSAVRGWLLLEHLKLWKEWNGAAGNPFHGKVDLSRIALMGHSRGGEAAATAAAFNGMKYYPEDANIKFDYGFAIKAVVAIAPADGQYKPAEQDRWISDVSYLTLQGAHDADVSSFLGSRQWDHVKFTQPGPWFKAEIYAYRANHGQFNTVWGRTDAGQPLSWLLNLKPLMPGPEQLRISKTYISAFLEATLHDRREYLPLFQDWRVGREWLPDTLYEDRYQDASYVPLASFSEDADLTTTTAPGGSIAGENLSVWHEGRIPWREGDRDYNGVFLGWKRAKGAPAATYTLTLPAGAAAKWQLSPGSTVELSVAAMDEDADLPGKKKDEEKKKEEEKKKKGEDKSKKKEREAPDFTLELVASDGATASAPASKFMVIPPPFKEQFTKLAILDEKGYEKDWEPVFQTVRIPLADFAAAGGGKRFEPGKLSAVRLKFDRTEMSVICISGIGFGKK